MARLSFLCVLAAHCCTARVVLVTGASRGIGRSIARRFAEGGDTVVVHFRTGSDEAQATLASLRAAEPPHCSISADVAEPAQCAALVAEVVARFGRLDVVVCNAGIYEETPFDATDFDAWCASWRRALAINLEGAVHVAFCAAKAMVASETKGTIVFVGSRGGFRGEPDACAYGASKLGMHHAAGSLAQALGPKGIRVCTVAPGFVATEMAEAVLAGPRGDDIRAQSPLGRVGTPEEVSSAVFFLASDEAVWCTGATLDCNGASFLRL